MKYKLENIYNAPEKNYIYPFFWPDENAPEKLVPEIEAVYNSGIGGLCVEARPFEDFGGESWWNTVRIILDEAKKRGMKVWILDDKHFPTGFANGYIKNKYPELRRHWLYEHHLDVHGPKKNVTARLRYCEDEDRLVCACMYQRTGEEEEITGEPVVIEIKDGAAFAGFDVPEGLWRVFFLYESVSTENRGQSLHIDMLSKDSARVLIEAVYEEHYDHLKEYFGDPLTGFFSDEPSFSIGHTEPWGKDEGFYYRTVGQPGNSLPWGNSVTERMTAAGIKDVLAYAPALWYDHTGIAPETRYAYMDAVTSLWNENFSFAVGDWCRSHGLIYTGHIIEDNNAHSRLGSSAGHYFRALSGQDISGIDIVLHQVLPGMSDFITAASISEGHADGRFFHYTLAHLASSLARITPHMCQRAMCELFGAFGWAEDTPFMKWMADFLMIRGINRFVPHAFSVKHPFEDCPPHFYANGCNPQYEGFSVLMRYINKVSTLLDGKVRRTDGAILYYAENEWMSGKDFMTCDPPAKALYDAHIDYDIIPLDALESAVVKDKKLFVNGLPHNFLLIPEAKIYHEKLKRILTRFTDAGLPVYTVVDGESGCKTGIGECVAAGEIAGKVIAEGLAFAYGLSASKLRIADFGEADERVFFVFNEEPAKTVSAELCFPVSGDYSELRLLCDACTGGFAKDGKIQVTLLAGESALFVFNGEKSPFGAKKALAAAEEPEIKWNIELLETGIDTEYRAYRRNSPLFNITAPEELPEFSGKIRYTGTFISDTENAVLDLGEVGSTAQMKINGTEFPLRIGAPYAWDISGALKKGKNTIEIIAANTLTGRIYDGFSTYLTLPASGVQGPVTLKKLL